MDGDGHDGDGGERVRDVACCNAHRAAWLVSCRGQRLSEFDAGQCRMMPNSDQRTAFFAFTLLANFVSLCQPKARKNPNV